MLEHDKTCIEVFQALPIQPDNRRPGIIITQFFGFCKGFYQQTNFLLTVYHF